MNREQLITLIRQQRSYLCIGLDTDPEKIPHHLRNRPDGMWQFNKEIIDATKPYCVSYKINTAFYEAMGAEGWRVLEQTVKYIGEGYFTIADAKRGDIGNTSAQYAKAFFSTLPFDAITVAPYMGADSVKPFLEVQGKWTILLGLTSNSGAADFELQQAGTERLYEKVIRTASSWGTVDNLMFVIGATQADEFSNIRRISPRHFYLVPGVGAQGGSLKEISEKAMVKNDIGLLVNVSRAVIYASSGLDFAQKAAEAAHAYQTEMETYLKASGIV
jgi:orotidine-5'-phosphate decarboxylase